MKKVVIYMMAFVVLLACNNNEKSLKKEIKTAVIPTDTVVITTQNSNFVNGVLQVRNQPFSGVTITHFDSSKQIASIQSFLNGKEEGWLYTFYPNGHKESQRYFTNGEKDSVHIGWWDNGNIRFEYHFKNGNYHGLFKEWYQYSGKLLKEIVYENGNDISGKGWRENGKLYMNFVNRDGRRYGLQNAQPCYSVKDGRGTYFSKDTLQ